MNRMTGTGTDANATGQTESSFVLALECTNRTGIVAAVAGALSKRGCSILDSQQFDDRTSNRFFMRVEAQAPGGFNLAAFRTEFATLAADFGMTWRLQRRGERVRSLIMVTKTDHCLNELIDLWRSDLVNIDIVGIVGNRNELSPVAARAGIPFHYIPVTPEAKDHAESELFEVITASGAELIVLARYMQILSDDFCTRFAGQVINIHHSFLPSFKGARPYVQAFNRGVKMIGATAHYVTPELDEGPIIAQSVVDIDHRARPQGLAIAGRRAERVALARAVTWHAEQRVFLNGIRTVVFD